MSVFVVLLILGAVVAIGASGWTSHNQMLRSESANHRLRNSRNGWAVFTLFPLAVLVFALIFLFF